MSDSLTEKIKSLSKSLAPRMIEMRRQFHRFPELSGKETRTTATIRACLQEEGIAEQPLQLPTGLVGIISGTCGKDGCEADGPVIAIRADIDALPIEEQTGLPFSSENKGVMHACGHDFHSAAILGAGMILSRIREEIPGRVKLFFQPAEETLGGAQAMIKAGALDNPKVDAVIAGHTTPEIPSGHIALKPGPLMASADMFRITIEGKGGHAAMPQHTIDPIVAGAAVVSALQTIVSRNISPLDTAVLSVGSFHAGSAPNIIPTEAKIEGTIRTFNNAVRQKCLKLLERVTTGVASGLGTRALVEHLDGIPPVINDLELYRLLKEAAVKVAGSNAVVEARPLMGSEDFSLYGEHVPVCYAWFGCGKQGAEKYLHHHPRYDTSEEALPVAAAFFARATIDCLQSLGQKNKA